MSYYFTNDPQLERNRKKINFRFLGVEEYFISDNGVFSKETLDYGSRVLLESVYKEKISGKILDLGCGIGVIGILLKKYNPNLSLTMVDINETAVELAKENSKLYNQNNIVIVSDGLSNVEDLFDIIVSNPPIRIGKQKMYSLLLQAGDSLKKNGLMYLVIRKQQGAQSAINYLRSNNYSTEIINKEKGYWIIKVKKD